MRFLRITAGATLVAALAACGGDPEVRYGPQAVHPSPSQLAQTVYLPEDGGPACGTHYHPCQGVTYHGHGHHRLDGSKPIID